MEALVALQTYFKDLKNADYKITQHKIPASPLIMYIVKLPKNQYIHVYVNDESDYSISLHLLNLDTGEKSRISSDFRCQSLKEVLDQMRPTFEHIDDIDEF